VPAECWGFEPFYPPGKLFVAGDNRAVSLDSRISGYGLVDVKDVVGKGLYIAPVRRMVFHEITPQAIQHAVQEDIEGDRMRGASTLTQQLVKNLFFGTNRSFLRKGAEATLVLVAEIVLGKQRILELYLNEVEWGPGVYGADAACRYHYRTSPRNIGREQSARLAAILPAPLKRRPERMNNYSAVVLRRMGQVGW
jgi:monofunctional biosynthetic peptidoglycan transglycosylase